MGAKTFVHGLLFHENQPLSSHSVRFFVRFPLYAKNFLQKIVFFIELSVILYMKALNSPENILFILTKKQEGLNNTQISKLLGVSNTLVNNFFKERGQSKKRNSWKEKNLNFFEEINSPESAYYLGWLASDGFVQTKTSTVGITLQARDKDVLEKLSSFIYKEKPLLFKKRQKPHWQDTYSLLIYGKKFCYDLKKFGIIDRKSFSIGISELIPKEFLKFFIRGFFEGDGCIYFSAKKNCCCFYTASDQMASDLKKILYSEIKLITKEYINKKKPNFHTITVQGKSNCFLFLNWLYSDLNELFLKRKYERYLTVTHPL